MTVSGHAVFENENYILLKKVGFLGIKHPMLTSFFVHVKSRGIAVKVNGKEKVFLLAAVGEMVKLGFTPEGIRDSQIFADFCEAVLSQGGANWHVFFGQTPQSAALSYART